MDKGFEFVKRFAEWEDDNHLFGWKIAKVNIWPYLRDIIGRIVFKKIEKIPYYINYHYLKTNENASKWDIYKYFDWSSLKKADVIFFNSGRRQKIDGKWHSPYLDDFLPELNYSFFVLEPIGNACIVVPPHDNMILFDPNHLAVKIHEDSDITRETYRFCQKLEKDFSIELDDSEKKEISQAIHSIVQNYERYIKLYYAILKIVRPKVLIITMRMQLSVNYLVEAAKMCGVKSIEYEHGMMDIPHNTQRCFAYKKKIATFPDYFWGLSSLDLLYYHYLPIPRENIMPIGNAFHEKRIHELNHMGNKNELPNNMKEILIISNAISTSGLMELAISLSESLDETKYCVSFRLHPEERYIWNKKYPKLNFSKVFVQGINMNHDINYYIQRSYCVVGIESTALIEALELNRRVYVYCRGD